MNPNEKYLGTPLLIGKNKQQCFTHLQEKVKNRLSIWGGSTLSQCGKSQMIKTVTNTIPTYTMRCLQIHVEVVNNINALQRDFWWGFDEKKGTYSISWKYLKRHKDIGGQGFRDLRILNQALLIRAAWRICTNSDALWVKCMSAKYFPYTSMLHASKKNVCSWAWKGVQKNIEFIKQHNCWRFGSGDHIKIWIDVWIIGMDSPPIPKQEVVDSENFVWVKDLFMPNARQ
ncbi:uncharacterized protein LOC113359183 [Papaver somniferum]|uniref:uncharacterized protein LOC113359183 n=1 Tax=Papaver somniferum TaxID=3469 RepID=UPI000E703807|nr:uncharacterized protein LOC113359183 [Papaver somniferum]